MAERRLSVDQIRAIWEEKLSNSLTTIEEIDRSILLSFPGLSVKPKKRKEISYCWNFIARIGRVSVDEVGREVWIDEAFVCRWCRNCIPPGQGTSNFIQHFSSCCMKREFKLASRTNLSMQNNDPHSAPLSTPPQHSPHLQTPNLLPSRDIFSSTQHTFTPFQRNQNFRLDHEKLGDCTRNLFPASLSSPITQQHSSFFSPHFQSIRTDPVCSSFDTFQTPNKHLSSSSSPPSISQEEFYWAITDLIAEVSLFILFYFLLFLNMKYHIVILF